MGFITQSQILMHSESVPCRQALGYTLERALTTYSWLDEIYSEFQSKKKRGIDVSEEVKRMRILADVFSVYLTTFVDGGQNRTYSLKHCWSDLDFSDLLSTEIVQKCKSNRHNRSAHEADSYGHFVSAEEILQSEIKSILTNYRLFIGNVPPTNCT